MRKARIARLSVLLTAGAISLPLLAGSASAVAASTRTKPPIGTQLAELGSDTGWPAGTYASTLGYVLAISGTTLLGGYGIKGVYVFTKTAAGWKQTALLNGPGNELSQADKAAISGTTAIIASSGWAYVFAKTAKGWKQTAKLRGSDTRELDEFGSAVAISGTTAVVGAPGRGRVYVFTKTGAVWKQVAELKASDAYVESEFGAAVAVSGTTAVVGAVNGGTNTFGGRAYVFTKTGAVWKQVAELKGSDTFVGDGFAQTVAISGTTVIVGAPSATLGQHPRNGGKAYVFTRASGWKQVAELKVADSSLASGLGDSLALSGTTAVLGIPGLGTGRAFLFSKTATGWKQVAELKGSGITSQSGGGFGNSVAISGTTAVVSGVARDYTQIFVFEA